MAYNLYALVIIENNYVKEIDWARFSIMKLHLCLTARLFYHVCSLTCRMIDEKSCSEWMTNVRFSEARAYLLFLSRVSLQRGMSSAGWKKIEYSYRSEERMIVQNFIKLTPRRVHSSCSHAKISTIRLNGENDN